MIPGDLLAKLPDPARAKLQLIPDLAADAMADADAALTRLNALARRQGSSDDDPSVVRLSAKHDVQSHRHQQLFSLANAIERWLRSLPPAAELEIVAASGPPPELSRRRDGDRRGSGDAAPRQDQRIDGRAHAAWRTRQSRGRHQGGDARSSAKLAADAKPSLRAERGRTEAVFGDPRSASFEASPQWVAGFSHGSSPTGWSGCSTDG